MSDEQHNLLVVLGPTASGKTRLGVHLCRHLAGEVISADSRQVYRGLDIGTGKDLDEYGLGDERLAVHLIDQAEPGERYSLFHYQRAFFRVFGELNRRRVLPVLVGGTGLYLDAVLERYALIEVPENAALREELAGLDLDALRTRLRSAASRLHNTTDLLDRGNLIRAIEIAEGSVGSQPDPLPELRPLLLGTRWPRPELDRRIHDRLVARIHNGLIEEVENLLARGVGAERLRELGLEYRSVTDYLEGRLPDLDSLIAQLGRAIRQFARRQLSWFRRMERRGHLIHWIDRADERVALKVIAEHGRSDTDES